MSAVDFEKYIRTLDRRILVKDIGKVTDVVGHLIEGYLPGAKLGSICEIASPGRPPIISEVIGFRDKKVLMMPLTELTAIGFGSRIELIRTTASIKVGRHLLGRVIDGLGMLVGQAAVSFEVWRGVTPEIQPVIDKLRASLK